MNVKEQIEKVAQEMRKDATGENSRHDLERILLEHADSLSSIAASLDEKAEPVASSTALPACPSTAPSSATPVPGTSWFPHQQVKDAVMPPAEATAPPADSAQWLVEALKSRFDSLCEKASPVADCGQITGYVFTHEMLDELGEAIEALAAHKSEVKG